MSILDVKDLKKSFGKNHAVRGISFMVAPGEIFGILGPNGAGKSTTLSLIAGLLRPDGGRVLIGDYDLHLEPQNAKKMIGIVPQEPALYPMLSAEENLRFWGTINGLRPGDLANSVKRVLDIVGLSTRARDRVNTFSGGMKRRLNIAAGLIHQPRLLIMDEPTVGIDPQSRNHILETVANLRDNDMSIVYTSHYVEEVEHLCDRVAIMDHGHLIKEGTLTDLLSHGHRHQTLHLHLHGSSKTLQDLIAQLPGVEQVLTENGHMRINAVEAEPIMPNVLQLVKQSGASISNIRLEKPNLESLFLQLTGRGLRD